MQGSTNPFDQLYEELNSIKQSISLLTNPPSNHQQIEIIDRPELLKRLNITEPTVIRWEKKGKVPALRIGSNVRYNWPAVIAALETK